MKHPQSICADLAAMLLSNLTSSASACSTLLSIKVNIIRTASVSTGFYATQSRCGTSPAPVPYPTGDSEDLPALPFLIDAFIQGAQEVEDMSKRSRKGNLHFLASVFANLTTVGLKLLVFF